MQRQAIRRGFVYRIAVKAGSTILSSAIAALLLFGFSSQAFANELNTLLLPDVDRSKAEFDGVRFIEIKYPQGSSLAALLNGRNDRIEFAVNGTANSTGGIGDVIRAVNDAALTENRSPIVIENASLKYFGTLKGYPDRAALSYRVEFEPVMSKYVLQKDGGDNQPAIVDLDWRDVVVRGPLLVDTEEHGTVDVNRPIGLVQLLLPEVAQELLKSEAKEMMEDPILDFSRFGLPMKQWHFSFDVTGKQLEQYDVFVEGEGATVSIYSIGESSFREGTYLPVEKDATGTIAGTEARMHSSGQITIAGYSAVEEGEGAEFAVINPSGAPISLDIFGFQFQVLMVLGGMMAVVAVVVLIKARK
jgi:hypothetical protein